MSEQIDGGPAFPGESQLIESGVVYQEGMTLRQYIATAALQGLLASPHIADLAAKEIASDCCQYADALLEQLAKAKGGETP